LNKVSVILVIYNSGKYLEDSIKSVLQQNYDNIELIIIDDGSKDNTAEILKKFNDDGKTVIQLREHTGNVGKLRNDAIKISKGEIVAFIDGDDVWEPGKITEQVKFISSYGMICANGVTIDEEGKTISNLYFRDLTRDFDISMPDLIGNNCVLTSSVMMKKSIIEDAGYFDESVGIRGEDYILWLNAKKITEIKFIARPLIRYRRHGANLSYLSPSERENLLYRTIEIREQFLNDNIYLNHEAAKNGLLPLYSELVKQFFALKVYYKSGLYSKKFLSLYPKKLSLRYAKYTLIFLISKIRSIFQRRSSN
jgi:teichuronic acid biosynthesis glycosyltransferase TuaG